MAFLAESYTLTLYSVSKIAGAEIHNVGSTAVDIHDVIADKVKNVGTSKLLFHLRDFQQVREKSYPYSTKLCDSSCRFLATTTKKLLRTPMRTTTTNLQRTSAPINQRTVQKIKIRIIAAVKT